MNYEVYDLRRRLIVCLKAKRYTFVTVENDSSAIDKKIAIIKVFANKNDANPIAEMVVNKNRFFFFKNRKRGWSTWQNATTAYASRASIQRCALCHYQEARRGQRKTARYFYMKGMVNDG